MTVKLLTRFVLANRPFWASSVTFARASASIGANALETWAFLAIAIASANLVAELVASAILGSDIVGILTIGHAIAIGILVLIIDTIAIFIHKPEAITTAWIQWLIVGIESIGNAIAIGIRRIVIVAIAIRIDEASDFVTFWRLALGKTLVA